VWHGLCGNQSPLLRPVGHAVYKYYCYLAHCANAIQATPSILPQSPLVTDDV